MNIEERKTNIVYIVQDFIFIFSLFIMQNLVVLISLVIVFTEFQQTKLMAMFDLQYRDFISFKSMDFTHFIAATSHKVIPKNYL